MSDLVDRLALHRGDGRGESEAFGRVEVRRGELVDRVALAVTTERRPTEETRRPRMRAKGRERGENGERTGGAGRNEMEREGRRRARRSARERGRRVAAVTMGRRHRLGHRDVATGGPSDGRVVSVAARQMGGGASADTKKNDDRGRCEERERRPPPGSRATAGPTAQGETRERDEHWTEQKESATKKGLETERNNAETEPRQNETKTKSEPRRDETKNTNEIRDINQRRKKEERGYYRGP